MPPCVTFHLSLHYLHILPVSRIERVYIKLLDMAGIARYRILHGLHGGFYTSPHVLCNLLNELKKRDKT